jgi:hypothetical protein
MKAVMRWIATVLRSTLALLFLIVLPIGLAIAGDPSNEATIPVGQDVFGALQVFRAFAEEGRAENQYVLGSWYIAGIGVPKDYAKASEWFRKAAVQGNPNAAYSLGTLYARGLGVPQDLAQAEYWYQKAADYGHADAQVALGLRYAAVNDGAIAARWLSRAAEQGVDNAQLELAKILAAGSGVPKDNIASYAWARIVEARTSDKRLRDEAVGVRQSVGSLLSDKQVSGAQKIATEWEPTLERPLVIYRSGAFREQDGILAFLTVQPGEAVVNWRLVRPLATPLSAIIGTVSGIGTVNKWALGTPRVEPYPQPGAKTSILLLLDVTGPENVIQNNKVTLVKMVSRAHAHHQIDIATYAERFQLLVPDKRDMETVLSLAKAAPPHAAAANLSEVLETGIGLLSSTPAERRSLFVLMSGHSQDEDTLNISELIESARRSQINLNFIVGPSFIMSTRGVPLKTFDALANATGGMVVKPAQLDAFLESPFQLLDSGATARFPLTYLSRRDTTDPEVRIEFQYGDASFELKSVAVNEARLEQEALDRVLNSCGTSCAVSFREQIQDRKALIEADTKMYLDAESDHDRLREYVNKCLACIFRDEADSRVRNLERQQSAEKLAAAAFDQAALQRFLDGCTRSCPDDLRSEAESRIEEVKQLEVKRGEDEVRYQAARGDIDKLQAYRSTCGVCAFSEVAQEEIEWIQQHKEYAALLAEEADRWKSARGNPGLMRNYVETCKVCSYEAPAQVAIKELEKELEPPANRFGALAVSNTGAWAARNGGLDRTQIEDEALSGCTKYARDCRVVLWIKNGCMALARGANNRMGWAWASEVEAAKTNALSHCSGRCSLIFSGCSLAE